MTPQRIETSRFGRAGPSLSMPSIHGRRGHAKSSRRPVRPGRASTEVVGDAPIAGVAGGAALRRGRPSGSSAPPLVRPGGARPEAWSPGPTLEWTIRTK
jgi:hypothetical protein